MQPPLEVNQCVENYGALVSVRLYLHVPFTHRPYFNTGIKLHRIRITHEL